MRNKYLYRVVGIVLVIFWSFTTLSAGEPNDKDLRYWSSGTAYLLPPGRWEVGLFQPLRYGFSESLEFSTHPLVCILMPNLSVKWSHKSIWGFIFSTRHNIYYPTPLLRTISREGVGGIISPEFHIPHIVSIYNEVLLTRELTKNYLITGKFGLSFAIKSADLDKRTTIDLPLIFPRLNVFYHGYGFRSGFDILGKISKRWNFVMDSDVFYYPGAEQDFAFEHKGLILWNKSLRFQLCFGYKLVYGEYPFGTQWHLLAPIFDLQWAW
jgi:hypothetical protein